MINNDIAKIFYEIARLLEIKGVAFKPQTYRKAAKAIEESEKDVSENYRQIPGVGKSIAQKIEEYLKKGEIKYYEELKKETALQQIIAYYFETRGLSLEELKRNAKKKKIVYSRYTKPAKQLLELAGSIEKAEMAIDKVAQWAQSRNLDYAIETIFKKWLELDRLKPKEIVKKPFYKGDPMQWSETRKKWYVISPEGNWLEYVGKESEIDWRVVK